MKIAFVVQRYGLEINGGAELHCRWIAEHMQQHWEIEVLTTKALDYITWKNHYTQSIEIINGVPVKRFPVTRTRNPEKFGRTQKFILENEHTEADEYRWLEEEGPYSPALIKYVQDHQHEYDYFIFFSYRYFHSYWGINSIPHKSVLVPTAERDAIIHLRIFKDFFRKPRAIIYNSEEERKMIQSLSHNSSVLGEVVGVGTEIPTEFLTEKFRREYGIKGDYIIYIGRIDENKGCDELFDFFLRFKQETGSDIQLVLIGNTIIKIPIHPDVHYLGFLSEENKFAALYETLLLLMPSFYESLSMVTNEAWAMHKPVLANARCDVLQGQCKRSHAGLYYQNYLEFKASLQLLLSSPRLRNKMGENGLRYFEKHYTWESIEDKYLSLFSRLEKEI